MAAGLAMLLAVAGCGPGTPSDPEAGATTEAVEPEELEQAVADAADTLLDAAAVETGMVSRTPGGEVHTVRWTVRVDEDTHKFAELRRQGEGELAGSDATAPAGVQTYAQVVTDDGVAATVLSSGMHGNPWTRHDEQAGMPVWHEHSPDNPLQWASGDVLITTGADDVDTSVRRAAGGTTTWTAAWQDDDRALTLTYSWTVAPDGPLSEHRRTFSSSDGETRERARFEPRQDAPTIALPTEGADFDLERLGAWPELPWPTAEPS